mmetsp:Transcript_17143/g.39624  ORF Transcript_17143/g.39624 Transcript_17143/m.39624 type:complete len:201 (-) Transcript_17143:1066-1668(-)
MRLGLVRVSSPLVILYKRLNCLDGIVWVDQFVVVCVGEEVPEKLLDVRGVLDTQNFEDGIDAEEVLLVARQRLQQLVYLGLDEEICFLAEQLEHTFYLLVLQLRRRQARIASLPLPAPSRCPHARAYSCFVRARVVENGIGGRVPMQTQLLLVQYFIRLQNLPHGSGDVALVHVPQLPVPPRVSVLKVHEFGLQFLELFC